MTKRDYISEQQEKNRATTRGILVLFVFIIIFIAVIIRFAIRSGTNEAFLPLMPTGKDAYEIAKDYTLRTLKPANAEFSERDYDSAKNTDSIYIVKSYFETRELNGQNTKTEFTATLKYNGGAATNERNWTLVKLEKR